MAEERTKKYAIEFKLYDGTTRSVSIEIPLGEDGGYYIPSIENKNGETLIHFTPSSSDMPAMEPIPVLNLNEAINMALTQAKESGEFDGKDGYTPVKGVDYFDGINGKDGADGYTPIKGVDYFDGQPGKNGAPGKDGADGQPGKDGIPGADGKTPVKGEDYWTDEDKQEIIDDVLEQIDIPEGSGGSAKLPVFDLSALGMSAITLPTGYSTVSTDTTALQSALSEGSVIFVIPVDMGGTTIPVRTIMQGIALGTSYQCTSLFVMNATSALVVNVDPGSITVMVMPASTAVGFPAATEADNGKFMQVVNGSWAAVALQDVSEVGA